jgi:protein-tyrosine kinase
MSRIDEALRRAAEQDAASMAPEEFTREHAAPEAASLAHEPFPVEAGERHLERALETPAGPGPVPEGAVQDAGDPTSERTDHRPRRLFERIDVQLSEKVVADDAMSPMSREQYRKLAAVLHDAQAEKGLCVMMITSAVPAEGKTLTAVNLALTLSESYRKRVLLVDADLRKPTLHQLFHLNASAGLSEGLAAPADAKLVVRQVSSRLSVLPGGRPTADPMAALSSRRMRQLIEEAKETFDWVILDTPPLVLLPDAHLLSSMVDGTLLVIRANSTPHAMVARAMDIIGRESITGVVLNQAAQGQPSFGTGAHPYYHPALVPEQRP